MAARCAYCGHRIIWVSELVRYRHKHTGSAYCASGRAKLARR